MIELANKVIALTNSSSRIINEELPLDDPKQRKPNISLANSILGWEPSIDLDSGLLRTINYFESKL